MCALTRSRTDDRIEAAVPLVPIAARSFGTLPPGVSADDLESVGHEALLSAAVEFDGPPERWKAWAKAYLKNRMQDFVRQARRRANRHVPLEVQTPTGESYPRPDPRAADPGELAAVRETLANPRATRGPSAAPLPSAETVVERVAALQRAMFDSIDVTKVQAMMSTLQDQAVKGDLKATKLLMELINPPKTGAVQQTAVVIQRGDLD